MNFDDLVKSRHSAVNFVEGIEMTEQDFKPILELTKLAPSVYNLQFAHYLIITDKAKKNIVYELSYQQHKLHTASAIVILLGDKNALSQQNAETIYQPLKMFNVLDDREYNELIEVIGNFEAGLLKDPVALQQEISTNSAISLAFFMLAAKHYGYDTCPMHVHNIPALRKYFNIPDHLVPLNLVAIGKSVDKIRNRGYRKPNGEFSTFNGFL